MMNIVVVEVISLVEAVGEQMVAMVAMAVLGVVEVVLEHRMDIVVLLVMVAHMVVEVVAVYHWQVLVVGEIEKVMVEMAGSMVVKEEMEDIIMALEKERMVPILWHIHQFLLIVEDMVGEELHLQIFILLQAVEEADTEAMEVMVE